ncbi:hypothetical protein [Allocoleopsis franciscana]|uniref:Uncharacterized protein n=1 Tax=Allocoleopsis franciscana PCC 7113 TaxID=1173027 RepID=K9WJU9_9CYAN|nr:hypothetical protein [Allocoleopsis franciscana]AFZ20473.1 hypothetical protein Mic7113_4803 [Allocoleopsis franciscana PCC 7113]
MTLTDGCRSGICAIRVSRKDFKTRKRVFTARSAKNEVPLHILKYTLVTQVLRSLSSLLATSTHPTPGL